MTKVLNVYKKSKVDIPTQKLINSIFSAAALPKHAGVQKLKIVSGRPNNTTPVAERFFQDAGVDVLLCVWEFIHDGRIDDVLTLMMVKKTIYTRMKNEPVLVMQIAKSCLSFSYLARLPAPLKTFKSLLHYATPTYGNELSYNSFVKEQFLCNGRLRKKTVFEVRMKVWPTRIFQGSKLRVAKCHCKRTDFYRLHKMLNEFEEAHNAIAMKIFWPHRDHFPMTTYNESVYILTSATEDFLKANKAFYARFRIRFTVCALRYRFSFVARRFDAVVA